MTDATLASRRSALAILSAGVLLGCGGAPGAQLEDARKAAYAAFNAAAESFNARDYAAAEPKLTEALDLGVLNPDVYCEATTMRAVCWAALGSKLDEALAELESLGRAAPNQAQIFAAKSFVLKKQGKLAASQAALAQARQFDRMVKEFQ